MGGGMWWRSVVPASSSRHHGVRVLSGAVSPPKLSTGVVGLAVDASAPQQLHSLYQQALHRVQTEMPDSAVYRTNLEKHLQVGVGTVWW